MTGHESGEHDRSPELDGARERTRTAWRALCAGLVLAIVVAFGWLEQSAPPRLSIELGKPQRAGTFPRIPLVFEQNRGQADSRIQYLARGAGYTMLFAPGETTLKLQRPQSLLAGASITQLLERWWHRDAPKSATLRLRLLGARSESRWAGERALAGRSHYFLGADRSQWITGVEQYARLRSERVLPGIDLVYYDRGDGALEYDFELAPGADPNAIRWQIEGATDVTLEHDGDLRLATLIGDVRIQAPLATQRGGDGGRREIEARFTLDRSRREVGFALGDYDPSRPLLIDPVIAYAAMFGGSDNSTLALGIASDASGAIYVSGSTCSLEYPIVAGAVKAQGGEIFGIDPCEDAFVTKLDPSGRSLVYSSFLGGSDRETAARVAVDASGAAHVTGVTLSSDFPTTGGAFQRSLNGARDCRLPQGTPQICGDAFVAKLSADGSNLLWSTLIGGSRFDLGVGIALDAAGAAYVQGWTNSADFPTSTAAYDRSYGGGSCSAGGIVPCFDSWVAKFSTDGSALGWSTYLGGGSREYGSGIVVDAGGNAYVVGATRSTDFPTTPGALRTTHTPGTQEDAYVAKLDANGATLVWSTLLGGAAIDAAYDLALDAANGVVVVGTTDSTDFPTTAGAPKTSTTTPPFSCELENLALIICGEAFVARLTPDGAALSFGTYLGGNGSDAAFAVARDPTGDLWIGGRTQSNNFPITPDALVTNVSSGGGYVAQLSADGATLRFASVLRTDTVIGLQAGPGGSILAGGTGFGSAVTPEAYLSDARHSGPYLLRLDSGSAPRLTLTPSSLTLPTVIGGTSAPKTVTITNVSAVPASLRTQIASNLGGTTGSDEFIAVDDCPATLAAGTSCTATAQYRASASGSRGGALTILSNAIDAPRTVGLSGSAARVFDGAFVPGTLNFAPRAAGTQSEVLSAGLVNQGDIGARNRGYTVTGPDAGDFTFDNVNCEFDNFCILNVRFAPMAGGADGPRSATVTLTTDLANDPKLLQLRGTVNSGPAATLSTTQLDFGAVRNTGSETRQVQLRNGGGAALTGIVASISGADYAISFNGCSSGTLAAQGSCNINVQLQPMGAGARTGTLSIAHNSPPAGPQTVALSGFAADPAGPIDVGSPPTRTEFGPTVVDTRSSLTTLIGVQNLGGGSMTGLVVAASGDVVQSNACPETLAAGLNCTIEVRFAPAAEGARTGTVSISSNAPGSPRSYSFTGTGVRLAEARLSPPRLDFGTVGIGLSSAAQDATLQNTGAAPLVIGAINVAPPFTQTNTCGGSVAPGASCTISLRFAPAAAGPATRLLSVLTNAPGREHSIGLRGLSIASNSLAAAPRALDFGNQALGTASAPRTVTLTNEGAGPIQLGGVVASRYFMQTNDCGTTLAVGASCSVGVSFAPTRRTPLETIFVDGTLSIAGDFDGSPRRVSLMGFPVAAGPARSLSVTSLPFGSLTTGATATGDLRVTSTGTAPLAIVSALIGGANAAEFTLIPPAAGTADCRSVASVATGTSCTYRVQFAPTSAGSKSATLTLTDNGAGSPTAVALSGTATAGPPGGGATDFTIAPGGGGAGTTLSVAAGQSATLALAVSSSGAPLPADVTFSASGQPQGTSVSFSPATLAAGSTSGTTTMTISTTSRTAALNVPGDGSLHRVRDRDSLLPLPAEGAPLRYASIGAPGLLAALGLWTLLTESRRRRSRALLLALAAAMLTASCGGGGGSGGVAVPTGPTVNPNGTPAGTHAITVTATSGGVVRTLQVALVVS